jgi:hypothetical protein
MSYTAPDYMDDLNRALDVSLKTDNCELQATAAINEVERLQGIEELLRDNRDHIVAALRSMQDHDLPEDAKVSGDLIELLKNLPDKAPDSDYDEDEEEEEEEEDASS